MRLPPEILYQIFVFLNYIKKSYLHNCALVNRKWCILSIPLLWSNPFSEISNKQINFINIIEIYARFLDKDTKQYLNINSDDEKPIFNYFEFLNVLDLMNLNITVSNWISNNKFFDKDKMTFQVTYKLFELFVKNCKNLISISLDTKSFKFSHRLEYLRFSSLNLKFLKLGKINNKDIIIKNLINTCKLIEEINITLLESDPSNIIDIISQLVSKQKYLRKFYYNSLLISKFKTTTLIEALLNIKRNSGNLAYIELCQCHFDGDIILYKFSCFMNLTIVINNCKMLFKNNYEFINDDFIDKYFEYSPPKTDVFKFDDNKKTNTIIIRISLPFINENT